MSSCPRAIRLVDRDAHQPTRCITVVGAGWMGAGLVSRICENQAQLDARPLIIHLVDPYPPGVGRVADASVAPAVAAPAGEITMFPDESSTLAGPITQGPDLASWAQLVRARRVNDVDINPDVLPELAAELAQLDAATFPSQQLYGHYVRWCLEYSAERLQHSSKVMWHRAEVTRVSDADNGAQIVELDSGDEFTTDVVVYALGGAASVDSPVLRDLVGSGAGRVQRVEQSVRVCVEVRQSDGRVIRAGGGVHPRRYALGAQTSLPQLDGVVRTHSNALALRIWDRVARAVLLELAQIRGGGAHGLGAEQTPQQAFDGAAYFCPEPESNS